MKKYQSVFLLMLMLPVLGMAQNLVWNFFPASADVNTMNTASFDPFDPAAQPQLSVLSITNNNPTPVRLDMKVGVYWNNNFLVEAYYETKPGLAVNANETITLSNRDLITNIGNYYFQSKGEETISVSGVIDANPLLKKAVLAGYFPDGNLQIRIWLRLWEETPWNLPSTAGNYKEFTIRIRNAGSINLVSPGAPVGKNPPIAGGLPLSFLWSSLSTGMNPNKLMIREYCPGNPPQLNNVANTGTIFYQTPQGMANDSGFSEFLPFVPGNYYAWQVSTSLSTEFETYDPDRIRQNPHGLKSDWFVFRFSDNADQFSAPEFQAHLNNLKNATLLSLYTLGYTPVGEIIYEGRTYSGQDALDLIDSLIGQDIQVELKD